jgi:hypothetical protein
MKKAVDQNGASASGVLTSRFRQVLGAVVVFAAAAPLPAMAIRAPEPRESLASQSGMAITVAPDNWGSAEAADIQLVLQRTAAEFQSYAGKPGSQPIKIRVIPRFNSPRVLYERGPDGEYVVHLTARDERWFQYAYQFSHELCHIFSNFDHKAVVGDEVASHNQWFEETLCETASLFTLKRLATTWESNPPARKWTGYGATFAAYASYLLGENHRRLPAVQQLDQWYENNRAALQETPYLREKNELAATALLPLFEKAPDLWRAIGYLNADQTSAAKAFPEYLADWQAACPPREQELVRQTMALFGIKGKTSPDTNMAWLAYFI